MSYLSLYRKYRSQTFSDLIGQDHVVRTLQNAVVSGKIAHAYLFTGPRGTGKTSSARLLSKCLNCETGPTAEPCNHCEQCVSITKGNCVDVYELDAASESGVDNVRDAIVDAVQYAPNFCRYKIFIIDEVHDLSGKAFDALLKTIEEPPAYVVFILATTEFNKVPPTVRSRCQKFEFHRASLQNLVERLTYVVTAEGAEAEPGALTAIARMADGGFRDALTLLEQALLTSEGKVSLQHVYDQLGLVSEETVDGILLAMRHGNVPKLIDLLQDVARRGRDPRAIIESMMYRLSDLTRAAYSVEAGSSADAVREAGLFETASHIGRDHLLLLRSSVADAHKAIREVSLPRIWLEAELLRIATHQDEQASPEPAKATSRQAVVHGTKATPPTPSLREPKAEVDKSSAKLEGMPNEEEKPTIPVEKQSADEIWASTITELPDKTPIALKLSGSVVLGLDGGVLRVSVKQVHLDWLTADPRRRQHLMSLVERKSGEKWTIQFEAATNGATPKIMEQEAVELPVEGEPLHKLASEILSQNGNSK